MKKKTNELTTKLLVGVFLIISMIISTNTASAQTFWWDIFGFYSIQSLENYNEPEPGPTPPKKPKPGPQPTIQGPEPIPPDLPPWDPFDPCPPDCK